MAPFEAGDEACFEVFDFAWWSVAGEDDLFVAVEEGVEGVEEFFLRAFFACEEVDVVDEEDVGLAEAFTEADDGVGLEGLDEEVGEFLAGDVDDAGLGATGGDVPADGLHEVGFAEA